MLNKFEQYQHCVSRGHKAESHFSIGLPQVTKGVCKYCGTHFWTETINHEENVPEEVRLAVDGAIAEVVKELSGG